MSYTYAHNYDAHEMFSKTVQCNTEGVTRRNTRRGAPSARAAMRREEGVEKEEEEEEEGSRRRVEGRRCRGAVAPPWPRQEGRERERYGRERKR